MMNRLRRTDHRIGTEMNGWLSARWNGKGDLYKRHAALNLKRCPLCGTLNARHNAECVTCRWHGAFHDDPEHIEDGLARLLDHCPDLAEVFGPVPARKAPLGWLGRIWNKLTRGRLDVRA